MTADIRPPAAEPIDTIDIQGRNKLYVQIDAIGVGTASGAAQFLPVFLTRLGATAVQVSLLTTMPGITGLFLALWVGRFLQKQRNVVPWFSLSRLLVISAYALTGIVPFFVPDNLLIYVILAIWAIATLPQTMVAVGFSVVMNAVSGPEGRYDLMSRRWSILGLTTAITTALAGQVLVRIGFHLNYQIVFVTLSLGGLISYYSSTRIRIPDVEPIVDTVKRSFTSNVSEYMQLIRTSPGFISFTLRQFVFLFGITMAAPLFPLYFVNVLGVSDAWIGLLYTVQSAVLLVGYFFWPRQSRRRGSRFVLLVTTFSVALLPAFVALITNQILIFVVWMVAGIFQAGIDLVFFDELMKTIPPRYSPTFVSLAQSIQYLAAILSPLVSSLLVAFIGVTNGLIVCSLVRLIGFGLFAVDKRRKPQIAAVPGLDSDVDSPVE